MLRVEAVSKSYGKLRALDGVSLQIRAGEFFGLLGPNGAGKSTLMAILSGLLRPDGGAVELDGQPFDPASAAQRRRLGLVPQALALWEELTAADNLRIVGELHGLAGATLRARVGECLELAQLADRADSLVRTFSGGMKRRLNLACALLHEPAVLLCDEPTVGVDPQSRNAIFERLEELNRRGLTIIYTTHYMEEAERLCDRIAVIDAGQIKALDTLGGLLRRLPFEEELLLDDDATGRHLVAAFAAEGQLEARSEGLAFRPAAGFRLSRFFAKAEELGLPARRVQIRQPSLEGVFLHLTGKSLRE